MQDIKAGDYKYYNLLNIVLPYEHLRATDGGQAAPLHASIKVNSASFSPALMIFKNSRSKC